MDCVSLEVLILLHNSSVPPIYLIFTYFLMATPLSVPSSHGSSSALRCTKAAKFLGDSTDHKFTDDLWWGRHQDNCNCKVSVIELFDWSEQFGKLVFFLHCLKCFTHMCSLFFPLAVTCWRDWNLKGWNKSVKSSKGLKWHQTQCSIANMFNFKVQQRKKLR